MNYYYCLVIQNNSRKDIQRKESLDSRDKEKSDASQTPKPLSALGKAWIRETLYGDQSPFCAESGDSVALLAMEMGLAL